MTDVFTKTKRSAVMACIRGRENKTTELFFSRLLRASKVAGWRRHQDLPGRPDFVFVMQHVAVFVDGCFWHGCPRCYRQPKTRVKYWMEKVAGNKRRDIRVARRLRSMGWAVLRIRECRLQKNPEACLRKILKALNN